MKSTKEAFTRDKKMYKEHQQTRVKKIKETTITKQKHTSNSWSYRQDSNFLQNSLISNTDSNTMRSSSTKADDHSKNTKSQRHQIDLRSNKS